jgi:cell division protein FtsW
MPNKRQKGTRDIAVRASDRPDYVLLGVVLALCLFGLLMLYDASVVVATNQFNDKFHFVTQQLIGLVIGIIGLLITSKIDYHFWKKLAPIMLLGGLVLLLAVFIPGFGVEVLGAKRWVQFGTSALRFQPSYLLCFALIAYLASWLEKDKTERWSFSVSIIPFGILMGLVLFIVAVLQKDLGSTSILAFTSVIMYFLAGAPLWQVGGIISSGLAAAGGLILLEPYRIGRIMSFVNKDSDSLGSGYHITQALIALGAGGWLGLGVGQSRQKYSYLPETQTDSIFAVLGEEMGFVGSMVLVVVFLYLLWRGLKIARHAPDTFGRLLAGGIMSLIGIQVFVNLFAIAAIIPLTGIPLPFISSGGTSLIVLLCSVGIVLNISKQAEL